MSDPWVTHRFTCTLNKPVPLIMVRFLTGKGAGNALDTCRYTPAHHYLGGANEEIINMNSSEDSPRFSHTEIKAVFTLNLGESKS